MKVRSVFFLSLFSMSFLFLSCSKDSDPCGNSPSKEYRYYISSSNKSKIPFAGNELLTYISDSGDTSVLTGQGVKSYFYTKSDYSTVDPACSNMDYWHFEEKYYVFSGTNHEFYKLTYRLRGGQGGSINDGGASDNDFIGLLVSEANNPIYNGGLDADYANSESTYTERVTIGGMEYKCKRINNFFYNHTYGILQITNPISNKKWHLDLK